MVVVVVVVVGVVVAVVIVVVAGAATTVLPMLVAILVSMPEVPLASTQKTETESGVPRDSRRRR